MPAFAGCQFAITVYVSGFAGIPAHFSRSDAEAQGKAFLEYVCRFSAVICVPVPLREMLLLLLEIEQLPRTREEPNHEPCSRHPAPSSSPNHSTVAIFSSVTQ